MSSTFDSRPSSNFGTLLAAASTKYTKRAGQTLSDHPFTIMLDRCKFPDDVLAILESKPKLSMN